MRFSFHFFLILLLSLSACNSPYKKSWNNFEYKIVGGGAEKQLEYGNYVEFHLAQRYINGKTDTLLGDTHDYMPRTEAFDSNRMTPAYLDIWSHAGKGDSIVMRISTDSTYNQNGTAMPDYMKKGGYVYTTIKIINIFTNRASADSANRAELRIHGWDIYKKRLVLVEKSIHDDSVQVEADSRAIQDRLIKNKVPCTRGRWGSFITVHDTGTGPKVAWDQVVAVNYTGRTLDSGKVFDSNKDPKFDHLGPYEVTINHLGAVMPGWTDGLMELRKGSKATVYIPSSLAYGKKGWPPVIKSNENVVYDFEVLEMIPEDSALQIQSRNRIKADSLNKK